MKEEREVKKKYEIPMYKLLAIFIIGLIVFFGMGIVVGNVIGSTSALNNADVSVPEYCRASIRGGRIVVDCNELYEGYSALELCNILSTPLKDRIRIVVISN